jgi:histidinol-phosphate aminotransferase
MRIEEIISLMRKDIVKLVPYSSARDEYEGEGVFLDANESPFNTGLNRYPDPSQKELRERLSSIKNIPSENIIAGNGSDEIIDLLLRTFCSPGKDNIIILPPTYGMYTVSAGINQVEVREVLLERIFRPDLKKTIASTDKNSRIIFICSPNNPTGNIVPEEDIIYLLDHFNGIVVVDEAYIDFCEEYSMARFLETYPNLVIMQTLSKAWGLAGIRLGILIAHREIINVIKKVKPPYNINLLTQRIALEALKNADQKNEWVKSIIYSRENLRTELNSLSFVRKIHSSDANFLLVEFENAAAVFNYLREQKVIVRDRSKVSLCENCLRISIGTAEENEKLVSVLKGYSAD